RFTLQRAQIIQLRAPHLRGPHHIHLIHDLRVDGEDAFYALAEAYLADGEAGLGAACARNDDTLKRLDALLVAFLDLDLNFDSVPWAKLGNIGAAALRQQFFDNLVLHDSSFREAQSLVISSSNSLSSSLSATRFSKSGRLRCVLANAVLRRQRRISS